MRWYFNLVTHFAVNVEDLIWLGIILHMLLRILLDKQLVIGSPIEHLIESD